MQQLEVVGNPISVQEWALPVLIGAGGVILLKNNREFRGEINRLVSSIASTDEGWNHMTILYLVVVAATYFIALRFKYTRPAILAWWWA